MGGGTYSEALYTQNTARKINTGANFGWDRTVRSTGVYKAHELVDPKKLNTAGKNIREALDNTDHPITLPIVVGLDSTGSMANTPRIVQKRLADLFGILVRKGYAGDAFPQIAVSSYGDAECDRVPLQISQFEADNRIDDALDTLYLEGGGGGNGGETASLLWYYLANNTEIDSYKKRGKKGYFFMIADEIAHDLTPEEIKTFIGTEEPPTQENLTAAHLAQKVQETWDVYVMLVNNGSAKNQGSQKFYEKLFGTDHVLIVENDETIVETIAAAIGRLENEDLDNDELIDDLVDAGSTKAKALTTAKTVAHLGATGRNVRLAETDIDIPEAEDTTVAL